MLTPSTQACHFKSEPASRPATVVAEISTAAAASLLIACTSAPSRLENLTPGASLYGMVYDTESQPVSAVSVKIDQDAFSASTEVNGRFFIDFLPFGMHSLSLAKTGYESMETDLDFSSRSQVAYIHLVSYASLLDKAEKAIGDRDWGKAREALDRAVKVKAGDPFASYLGAVIDFRTKDYEKARAALEELLKRDYREPFVYLFLADIRQYDLVDKAKAIEYLSAYLASREDGAVRKRIDSLRGE